MDRASNEHMLKLLALLRMRYERDLRWLADYTHTHPEMTMLESLEEMHRIYIHYVRLESNVVLQALSIRSKEGNTPPDK